MPTKLTLCKAAPLDKGHIVLFGFHADLAAQAAELFPDEKDQSLLDAILAKCTPSSFAAATATATLPARNGYPYVRVDLVAVPTAATRYNCKLRPDALTRGISKVSTSCQDDGCISMIACLPAEESADVQSGHGLTTSAAVARALHVYTRKGNKTETSSSTSIELSIRFGSKAYEQQTQLEQFQHVADGVRTAAAYVDAPCNEMHASILAQRAVDQCQGLPNVSIEQIVGDDLEAQGFGGIFGVGKAAEDPARLVILKYEPEGATKTVALAGKGIVYDTGGLSIKGKTNMPGMKRDMGGAAGVLNAFVAVVKSGFKHKLYCLLAIAENAVGPKATRPDDIHLMYSGKTVEINNTDAEGRLVLGDAVAYAAKTFNPDLLLNMCTLTGAQGVATGQKHAAIVCSDEAMEQATVAAGKLSGDLVHPLMWCPELFTHEFASAVADMKNSVKSRSNAQVSCAAQFIGNHLPEGFTDNHAWLHVDMAAPAFEGERGTGYGVALLHRLLMTNFA
eukprot:TRINITY_DN6762_c0_g1_i2.p1 TRINITY_DN6762_c0_g1~~TRINITY_DN6762_c0_g1_i2.p1  ORF type:complete len:507 (+),score=136.60 TRINITY_DN6762_c0_g1_i2:137-1657(+)